jgi:hypothetical protein
VGAVVVTVTNDTVAEGEVRGAVERRLAQAKIAIDGEPGPELVVSVSAERNRAERGRCECGTFRVHVSLREPVMLERGGSQGAVSAITWHASSSVWRFSVKAPRLAIMDAIERNLSSFLRAVASDTQQAEHERGGP